MPSSYSNFMNDPFTYTKERAIRFDQRLQKSFLGRHLRAGAQESFGWDIAKGFKNRGFLGIRSNLEDFRSQIAGQATGLQKFGAGAKFAGKTAFAAIGPAYTAYAAYTGYQQNGVIGAVGGVAESVLWSAGIRSAMAVLGNPVTLGLAAATAGAFGAYNLGEAGRRYQRQLKSLEVGGDENMINAVNSYGASTMRQRAAIALNNSHINRRIALGNEAQMFHNSF